MPTPDSFQSKPWASGKQWLSDTWQPTKKHYGLLFGCILLGMGVSTIAQMVPVLGFLISMAIAGPIYIGVFYIAHRCLLAEKTHVQEMFICFEYRRDAWWQSIILALLNLLFIILLLLAMGISGLLIVGLSQVQLLFTDPNLASEMLINWPLFAFVECLIVLVFLTFIIPMYYFVYPLIFFKKLSAWDSMMLSSKAVWGNMGSITNFGLIASVIVIVGVLCFVIGVFFTLPWLYMAYMKSYHDIFDVPDADQTGLHPLAWNATTNSFSGPSKEDTNL